jgi:sporulation protein YlmC with PRC-barrel domain
MDLLRDILDKQIVDRERTFLGRVDGIVLELRDGAPPRIDHFELGFEVLARRLGTRAERFVQKIRQRWSIRSEGRYVIPWPLVGEITEHHVKVEVTAQETPAFEWENWLRKHVITKLPGGK